MTSPIRLIARLAAQQLKPRVGHHQGIPPELTEGKDLREALGPSAIVAIEERTDGVFLLRFTAKGEAAGDTWHTTVEEAQEQARYEFGELLCDWVPVPRDVEDMVSFGLSQQR